MNAPLYGTPEAREAPTNRCHQDVNHLASREVFEELGGCPYCLHTQGERMAAVQAKQRLERRIHGEVEDALREVTAAIRDGRNEVALKLVDDLSGRRWFS